MIMYVMNVNYLLHESINVPEVGVATKKFLGALPLSKFLNPPLYNVDEVWIYGIDYNFKTRQNTA